MSHRHSSAWTISISTKLFSRETNCDAILKAMKIITHTGHLGVAYPLANIADWPFLQKTGSRSSQIGSGSNSPDTLIRGYFGDASQLPLTGDAVTANKICRVNRKSVKIILFISFCTIHANCGGIIGLNH